LLAASRRFWVAQPRLRSNLASFHQSSLENCAVDLDRIDLALLNELAGNARATHVELADRIGLSPTACARRQKNLEDAGLIAGYRASISLKKLGLGTTIIVRITLDSQRENALEAFEKAIHDCPSVVRCLLMSGSDDYLIIVVAEDIEDFEHIHKLQLSRLPGVARVHSSFAIREVVNREVPPALFRNVATARVRDQ
jgi:Lrp/AsnC family leucine-responsive transcriptional regulator